MTTSPEMIAAGRALVAQGNGLILLCAVLGLLAILAGLASRRLGAPILLVFIGLGMLAGQDGILGLHFADYYAAYVIGSVALAVILFEGGVKTRLPVLRMALWPALALATIGVVVTAFVVAGFVWLIAGTHPAGALLVGAAAAPTDAAAVSALLRRSQVAVPERVSALLEVESGLNDPMSIFLTVLLLHVLTEPHWASFANAAWLFVREMAGGAMIGLGGGWVLSLMLRRLPLEPALATVLALAAALAVFGLAQTLGTSGFLAVYVAAIMAGATAHPARDAVEHFFEGLAWLSQIALFVVLGLLVTPHNLAPFLIPGVCAAIVLILVARPVAVFACLAPFRFAPRDIAFASWVGLRGAVPIFLSILPALADPDRDARFFGGIFVLVVASLVIQGWTIAPAARLLGYGRDGGPGPPAAQTG